MALFFQLNDNDIRIGKKLGVTISFNNHRLFVGNIPKNRGQDDLFQEFSKHSRKSSVRCTLPLEHNQYGAMGKDRLLAWVFNRLELISTFWYTGICCSADRFPQLTLLLALTSN